MKTKNMQARSKTGENVALHSNTIKLRRCEIKLRRIGVNRNKRHLSKPTLQEQQIPDNLTNINNSKRTEQETLPQKSKSDQGNSVPKVKKCVVRLKRINFNSGRTHESTHKHAEHVTSPKMSTSKQEIPLQKMQKCIVQLKRIHFNSDPNQNVLGPKTSTLTRRYPLSLTRRRAEELGLRSTKNSNPPVSLLPSTNVKAHKKTENSLAHANKTSDVLAKSISTRNLADKPSIITEILSTENEDFLTKPMESENNNAENRDNQLKEANKFFHKDAKNMFPMKEIQNLKSTKKATNKQRTNILNKSTKNRQFKKRQKASISKNDIYEFLSQSQTSDSDSKKDNDVAYDIVQKMIDEGKVAVTRNYKGKPRKIHHFKNRRNKPKTAKKLNKENNIQFENVLSTHDDNYHNDDGELEQPNALPVKTVGENSVPVADSTFSQLARSVLMSKAVNNVADAKTALDILQRYNSTPLRPQNKSPQLSGGVELSPIQSEKSKCLAPNPDRSIISSEEQPVILSSKKASSDDKSKTMVSSNRAMELFGSSSRELPSFSGTNQARNNTKFKSVTFSKKGPCRFESSSELPTFSGSRNTRSQSNKSIEQPTSTSMFHSSIVPRISTMSSSFSSNDSNAENQPPAILRKSTQNPQNLEIRTDENDVIHSARQIPNPRRTLAHRSPLKAINIIDIVTLPPYTGPKAVTSKVGENLLNDKNNEKSQLFGFEEYLDNNNEFENEVENVSEHTYEKATTKSSRCDISKQLRKLRRLRPKLTSKSRSSINNTITKNIFDGYNSNAKGNRNIKEMLCSTMVNNVSTIDEQSSISSNTLAEGSDSDDAVTTIKSLEKKTAELFGDPETTFDQKSFRRTYERPLKRKRKLIHQLSDIFDSDPESSDDEIESANTSVVKEKGCKTKRRQLASPKNEELDKFVSEFNSILKEAEDYELIVE